MQWLIIQHSNSTFLSSMTWVHRSSVQTSLRMRPEERYPIHGYTLHGVATNLLLFCGKQMMLLSQMPKLQLANGRRQELNSGFIPTAEKSMIKLLLHLDCSATATMPLGLQAYVLDSIRNFEFKIRIMALVVVLVPAHPLIRMVLLCPLTHIHSTTTIYRRGELKPNNCMNTTTQCGLELYVQLHQHQSLPSSLLYHHQPCFWGTLWWNLSLATDLDIHWELEI